MRLCLLALIYLVMISSAIAQELPDPDSLSTLKVYTNLNDAMAHPESVFRLNLSRKKLKEVPEDIFKFKNLMELNLNKNKLTALPEKIGTLKNLHRLSASNNKLTKVPESIGKLVALQYLELNRNLIDTIPPEIGKLVNLEELQLWDNELNWIPDEIHNCGSLKVLELRGILFTDEAQKRIIDLLPYTKIYFSPSCNCKQ